MIDTNRIPDVEWGERAVSPVIGVILMVAITVILAAVIGTFVLDLGQNVQNTGPSASMGFTDAEEAYTADDNNFHDFIVIEHQSGESLDGDEVRIIIRNVSDNSIVASYDNGETTNNTGETTWDINSVEFNASSTVTVGDQIITSVNNNAAGSPAPGFEYSVTVVSTETDNRIATGTVEVN